MKYFILAAALLITSATTALAQEKQQQSGWPAPPTAKTVETGKQVFTAKTTALEAAVNQHNTAKAEELAAEVVHLMKLRVAQTRYTAEANTGAKKDAILKHMNAMENTVVDFMNSMRDVNANGPKLVTLSQTYIGQYQY